MEELCADSVHYGLPTWRLNSLAVLSFERELTESLDTDE